MVLVPEARTHRQEVRQAIAAQFWGQPVAGARSLDGLSRLLPCEPPALPQTAPSGLSRAQQLLAFQAVALPVLPAFNGAQGGLVMDRALARMGGRNWWTVLLGRARAQRMWSCHRQGMRTVDAVKKADNYSLCSRTRVRFGKGTTLHALAEVADLQALKDRLNGSGGAGETGCKSDPGGGGGRLCGSAPVKASVILKQDVLDHEIVLTTALNQEHVDSSAAYDTIPLTSTLDVKTKDRTDGLQYRAGLHYVHAPETELRAGGLAPVDASEAEAFDGAAAEAGPWRATLHAQGAVAVEGEAVLWQPPAPPSRISAGPPLPEPPQGGDNDSGAYGTDSTQVSGTSSEGPVVGRAQLEGSSKGSAGDAGRQPRPGPFSRASSGFQPGTDNWNWEVDAEPLPVAATSHGAITRRRLHSEWRSVPRRGRLPAHESWARYRAAAATPGSGSEDEDGEADPLLAPVVLPDAAAIQTGLTANRARLDSLRTLAAAAAQEVRAGGLVERLDRSRRGGRRARRPYSPWLAQPYVKANGAVGCLARMPLPMLGGPQDGSVPPALSAGVDGPDSLPEAGSGSVATRIKTAWNPYLRETTLRIFASAGLSAQLGRFTRPLLDFTSLAARLDLGMTSQQTGGGGLEDSGHSGGGSQLRQHRAFALEGRHIWHAASLSAAQQLVGPLRARADLRFSLHVPGGYSPVDGDRASLRSLWAASVGMRPAPLERVFGLDMVLPKTAGSGRACIWWSPARREAMAEVRLC